MGSPRVFALVLFLLSSASGEEKHSDSMMMQREVDLSDLFDPKDMELLEQREVTFDHGKIIQEMVQRERTMQKEEDVSDLLHPRGRPSFGPRSFGGPPALDYPVQFPPGRPTSDNLQAICLHGNRRPRYPDSYFPASGFGQGKRRAAAVNRAESWFSSCCQRNQTWEREVTLCCATQAWELSIKTFCEDDSSVKDRLYHCCRQTGGERLDCFHGDAPNPDYSPTEELPLPEPPSVPGFSFKPDDCQRTVMTPYSVRGNTRNKMKKPSPGQKVDINFPLGRPTADNMDAVCGNQKLRPLYSTKCLPGSGYEWLARQAKSMNRLEKRFKQCCRKRKGSLQCAEQKWREELNRFCSGEKNEGGFHCCSSGEAADDQFSCFQTVSPDPNYNLTSAAEETSLDKVCDVHKLIKKKFSVGFPLKSLVNQCCPLSGEDKNSCVLQRLEEISMKLCSGRIMTPSVRRCCRMSSMRPPQCLSKILLDAVTSANGALRKRKRCPLS